MPKFCRQCGVRLSSSSVSLDFCSFSCCGKFGASISKQSPKPPTRKKKVCDLCQKFISLSNFERHHNSCKEKDKDKFEKYKQINDKYKCPKCYQEFKNLKSHFWRMHTEEGRNFDPSRGNQSWNKGLTKENDIRIKERGICLSKRYKNGTIIAKNKGVPHTEETKAKISAYAKGRNGRNHPTRKTFYYKHKDGSTVVLESTYEVKVAESLDSHNIHWVRPDSVTWTDSKGEDHRYFPDFYLVKYDIYLDPKNDYLIKKDAEKIQRVQEQNDIKVIILNSKNLKWAQIKEKIT